MPVIWHGGLAAVLLVGQTSGPAPEYHIYAGSTHAHTSYTWSHGEQFAKSDCGGIQVYGPKPGSDISTWTDGYVKSKTGCSGIFVIDGSQYPSPSVKLRADWQEYQGPPREHFKRAKANGYDFYITTDHSQEAAFQPPSADNTQWMDTKRSAAEATEGNFVALAGFEYSENDGPGGTGHINVINTDGMLNALAPGIDLPYFYKWLATAQPNGDGPVVASFNHPMPDQYNNWDYRDPKVTDILTMLEVINSNNKIHYPAFVNALDHGWKVSPVCGNDNHGLTGIPINTSRTLCWRRSDQGGHSGCDEAPAYLCFAGKNLQCRYTVNGAIMGSTLDTPGVSTSTLQSNSLTPPTADTHHQDRYRQGPRRGGAGIHAHSRLRGALDAVDRRYLRQVLLRAGLDGGRRRCAGSRSGQPGGVAGSRVDRPIITHSEGQLKCESHDLSYAPSLSVRRFAALLLLSRRRSCFAQLATVQGEARDTSQSVVPGAPVSVTNSKTNVAARTTTNATGFYSVSGLIPGTIPWRFKAQGFETGLRQNLTLDVRPGVTRGLHTEAGSRHGDRRSRRECDAAEHGQLDRRPGNQQQDRRGTAAERPQLPSTRAIDRGHFVLPAAAATFPKAPFPR